MKFVLLLLILMSTSVDAGPQYVVAPPNGDITLEWNYPTNLLCTNLWFNIYGTTNLDLPVEQWPFITNVVGTNLFANLSVVPGANFFVMTASNFWGESSITSNITSTPSLPLPMNGCVTIQKAP